MRGRACQDTFSHPLSLSATPCKRRKRTCRGTLADGGTGAPVEVPPIALFAELQPKRWFCQMTTSHEQLFDKMRAPGSINHVNDPGKAFREMARVVKPDGVVVVADEVPDLPNRQLAHKLGLHKLQKWILSGVFFLGQFSPVILEQTDLKIEPLVDQSLRDGKIHKIWDGLGYCVVGKPKLS